MKENELQESTTQLFKEVAKQDSALLYLDGYSVNCVQDEAEIGRPQRAMACSVASKFSLAGALRCRETVL